MSEFPLDKYVKVKALEEQGKVCLYELKPENVGAASRELPKKVAIKTFDTTGYQVCALWNICPESNISDANAINDQREFDTLKSHPNIVHCLGQCQIPNDNSGGLDKVLVMEHCQGNLEQLLAVRKKLSPAESVYIVKQILDGLDCMHNNKIVHRTLDLANVLLLTEHDNPDWNSINIWEIQVKLGGFETAKNQDNCSGTKTKLPKNIWSRDPGELEDLLKNDGPSIGDYKDDIEAVGKILYKIVTGTKMEGPVNQKVLNQVVGDESLMQFFHEIFNGKGTKFLLKHCYVKECMRDMKEMKHDWQIIQMQKQIIQMQKQRKESSQEIQCLKEQLQQKSAKLSKLEEKVSKIISMVSMDLFNASRDGDLEKMKDAIKKGAELEWKHEDLDNFTPLMEASLLIKADAVKLLLKEGAWIDNTNKWDCTALWIACWNGKEAVARILIKNGADVEKEGTFHRTPLMGAAQYGHSTIVRLLLEAGAQIDKKNNNGKTALSMAKEKEITEVVKILEEWANI